MRISSNFSKIILVTLVNIALGFSSASAQPNPEKDQIILAAKTTCETAAQAKYGANSVKSISDRVKWSKGHKGALVKMRIKPKAKKSQKYHCVVDRNTIPIFFKV